MASNISVSVGADITDLQTKYALASAATKKFAGDVRSAAKDINAALKSGDTAGASMMQAQLKTSAVAASGAAAEVGKLKAQLSSVGALPAGVVASVEAAAHSAGSAREAFVILHETMSGRFSRVPGSLMILVQQLGSIGPAALGGLVGVGALAFGIFELAENALATNRAFQSLETTMALAGQIPSGGADEIRTRVAQLATSFTLSKTDAAKYTEAVQGSMKIADQATRDAIGNIIISLDQLKNVDAEKTVENLTAVGKQTQSFSGLKGLSDTYSLGLDAEIDKIEAKTGDATVKLKEAQQRIIDALQGVAGGVVAPTQKFDQGSTFLQSFLRASAGAGDQGTPEEYTKAPTRPDPTTLITPPPNAGREDEMKTLTSNINAADEAVKKLATDYTLSASKRAAAEATARASIVIPKGTEGTPEAARVGNEQAEANYKAQQALIAEKTSAETASNERLAASGTASAEAVTAARIASMRRELAYAGQTADQQRDIRQRLAVEQASLSNEAATREIDDLKRVAEADKSGSDKKLADLQAVQAATIRLHRPQAEQDDAGEKVRAAQTEQIGGWQSAYDAGIKQQLSAGKGNADAQSAILKNWQAEAIAVFGENSAEFAKAEEAMTRVAEEQNAARLADLKKSVSDAQKQGTADLRIGKSNDAHVLGATPEAIAADKTAIIDGTEEAVKSAMAQYQQLAATNEAFGKEFEAIGSEAAQKWQDDILAANATMQEQIRADWQKTNHEISSGLSDALMDGLEGKKGGAGAGLTKFIDEQLKSAMTGGLDSLLTKGEGALGIDSKSPGGLLGGGLNAVGLGGVSSFFGLDKDASKDAPQIAATTANTAALGAVTAALRASRAPGAAGGIQQGPTASGEPLGQLQGPTASGSTLDVATQANTQSLQQVGGEVSNLASMTGEHSAVTKGLQAVTELNTVAMLPNTIALIANTIATWAAAIADLLPFAAGGRPEPGKTALVGERGPELFVPDSRGTIIPNHRIGDFTAPNFSAANFNMAPPDYATAGASGSGGLSNVTNMATSSRAGDVRATVNQTNHFSGGHQPLEKMIADHVRTAGKSATRAMITRGLNR